MKSKEFIKIVFNDKTLVIYYYICIAFFEIYVDGTLCKLIGHLKERDYLHL